MSKFAFLFPGQGSQHVGMLADFSQEPVVKAVFEEASEALGFDVWALCAQDANNQLNQTEFTQPALLTSSIALWQLWLSRGGKSPVALAGHSLGEYSALVAAQSLKLADAVRLVAERGVLMQQAVPEGEGAMAAILGLELDVLTQVCADASAGDIVAPANLNAPGQIVISGSKAAVDRAVSKAQEAGAKRAILLDVSAPSHCELMRPAAEKLQQTLAHTNLSSPQIPVVNNADADVYDEPKAIRDALIRQLYQPVRWIECVQKIAQFDITHCIECGPNKVLMGLGRRINRQLPCMPIADTAGFQKALGVA